WYSQKIIRDEVESSSFQLLDQTRRLMDNQLNSIDSLSIQLANVNALNNAIEANNLEEIKPMLQSIQTYLRDFYTGSPFIQSIYIYYQNLNLVQSAITGLMPASEYKEPEIITTNQKMGKKREWIFSEPDEDGHTWDSTVTLIRPIPYYGEENSAAIIVNVNQQYFFQNHPTRFLREGEEIWIIHPSGNYGFETRVGELLPQSNLALVQAMNSDVNTFNEEFQGKQYSFSSVVSPHTGWKYVHVIPTKTLYTDSQLVRLFLFLVATISIVISIIIAIFISKRIYNPVQALIKMLEPKTQSVHSPIKRADEIPYIFSTIEKKSYEEKLLKRQLQNSILELRQAFLKTLLYEKSDDHQTRIQKLREYEITFHHTGFFVTVIRLNKEEIPANDVQAYKYFIMKLCEEILSEKIHVEAIEMEGTDIALICNIKDNAPTTELQHKIIDLLKVTHNQIVYHIDFPITIAIGEFVSEVGCFADSYQTALEAINATRNGTIKAFWKMEEIPSPEIEPQPDTVTTQIVDYIQANYKNDISLNGIADKLGLDPSHISRLFKQDLGINFSKYLINLRIQEAKRLLQESELSVKEIGEAVGYINTHSFIRIFKKYEGIPPGKYRENVHPKFLDSKEIY